MADLPIWSDNERIDSEVVLLSVWAWIRAYPVIGLTLLGYSFAIVHRRRHGEPDLDLPCKIRECNDENCQKCAEEAGGYDFRWMHFAWFRLFGNSSGWHVVYRRSLARTSSVSRLSKLRDGQYATAMVLPGSRNGCSWSWREIWRTDGIEGRRRERARSDRNYVAVSDTSSLMDALRICIALFVWRSSCICLASLPTATNAIRPRDFPSMKLTKKFT